MPLGRRRFLLTTLTGALASSVHACADSPPGPAPATTAPPVRPTTTLPPAPALASTATLPAPPALAPSPSVAPAPAPPGLPGSPDLEFRDVEVPGDRALGRRFLLCVPRHLGPGEKVPLVVLLHGLGETGDERAGAHAWVERYGLASAYERLRRPPIARTSRRNDWTDARLAEVNATLAEKPFSGLCLVCPYTPNIHKLPDPAAALDAYARWITEVVIPRARRDAPVATEVARTAIDGCSLGGYVALEVFLRRLDAFGALGGVQSAVSESRAPGHAARLATALATGAKPVHLLTSEADPFRAGNQRIAAELRKKGLACDLRLLPGPHDQPWLREAGTIEMLLWHERRATAS